MMIRVLVNASCAVGVAYDTDLIWKNMRKDNVITWMVLRECVAMIQSLVERRVVGWVQ